MAQTAVDLPDPLESKGGNALNSADDLLAQLAGEEVDRLLSEADAEPAPANRTFDPPAAAPAAAKRGSATDAALDALFDELNAAEIPGAPAAPVAAATAVAAGSTDAALDDLFNQLNAAEIPGATGATVVESSATSPLDAPAAAAPAAAAPASGDGDALGLDALFAELNAAEISGAPAPAAGPATARPAVAAVAPSTTESVEEALAKRAQSLIDEARRQDGAASAGVGAGPDSVADALAAEMEADERAHSAALRRMDGAAEAAPAGSAVIDEAAVEEAAELDEQALEIDVEAERVPLVVRVLEWINAPLAGLSDRVREVVGKVALVTTFNSVAVLLYVFLFRRA